VTDKEKRQMQAEQFVRTVLKETFKQPTPPDQIRKVAEKVSKAIPVEKRLPRMIAAE
jgi:hypothetical protein